jgi:hypothetical protein
MYLYLSAAFLFTTHGLIFLVIVARRRLNRSPHLEIAAESGYGPWIAFGLGAALTLLCYGLLLPQFFTKVSTAQQQGERVTDWKNPLWTVIETVQSFGNGNPLIPFGVAAGGLLALVGVIQLFRRHPLFALIPVVHGLLTLTLGHLCQLIRCEIPRS